MAFRKRSFSTTPGSRWGRDHKHHDIHADKLVRIHLNMLSVNPSLPPPANPTPEEQRYRRPDQALGEGRNRLHPDPGHSPQTLAYGLTDSPAGLGAWIAEKFHIWTDHAGDFETAVHRDHLLANISLYWFTGAIGSSFWPYYERLMAHGRSHGKTVDVPTGYAAFPKEIRRPPRIARPDTPVMSEMT
jgi:microsomal epoxide hydrolase